MSKIYLKVKIKSLAEEARIIRKEETKTLEIARKYKKKQGFEEFSNKKYELYSGLIIHRKVVVSNESRAALIAYGFLKRKKYSQIENTQPLKNCIFKTTIGECGTWNMIILRISRLIFKYSENPEIKLAQQIINNQPIFNLSKLNEWLNT